MPSDLDESRQKNDFQLPKDRPKIYGIETVSFLGCRLWNALPNEWKNSQTINEFKRKIKQWDGDGYTILGIQNPSSTFAVPSTQVFCNKDVIHMIIQG